MQTFADFERQQQMMLKELERRDLESISCPNCSSQFFEHVRVAKYKADHNVVLGQDVPIRPGSAPYVLLRCIYCKDLLEPRVLHNTRDVIGGDYNELLDTLEGKKDPRKKAEEEAKAKEQENAVHVEEL